MARGHLVFSLSVLPSFRHSVLPSVRPSVSPSFRHSVLPSYKAKEKYGGMFEIQKSGDKTSSGEIGLDIRTHASPKESNYLSRVAQIGPLVYFYAPAITWQGGHLVFALSVIPSFRPEQ